MARSQFVHRLVRKYRQLDSERGREGADIAGLTSSLEHLAAVILLFEPDYQVALLEDMRPYRRTPDMKRGGYVRTALEVLKASPVPLTMRQIAGHTLRARGVRNPSRLELETLMRGLNGKVRYWAESDGAFPARFRLPVRLAP